MICSNPFARRAVATPDQIKNGQIRKEMMPHPCGQCLHCRINQSRVWQTRLLLETLSSNDSTFITLTYDDDHVDPMYHLVKDDLTLFLKRYRKRMAPAKLRYFAVGEYGDTTWRPHFHIAMFSDGIFERCVMPCEDMRKRDMCTKDCILYKSWGKGNVSLTATLNQSLASYITGYIKKKATKDRLINRPNEYATMSKGRRDPKTKEKIDGGLGYRSLQVIADKLSNHGTIPGGTIRSLNFGRIKRPLGRYLEAELRSALGLDDSSRVLEFDRYQEETFAKHFDGSAIVTNILKSTEGQRNSQTFKHQNNRQKRSI